MSKKQVYDIPTKFIFSGTFRVKAESQEQAEEYVREHCGLTLGRDIHTTLPYDDVDWEFDVHSEKLVGHEND